MDANTPDVDSLPLMTRCSPSATLDCNRIETAGKRGKPLSVRVWALLDCNIDSLNESGTQQQQVALFDRILTTG